MMSRRANSGRRAGQGEDAAEGDDDVNAGRCSERKGQPNQLSIKLRMRLSLGARDDEDSKF